MKALNHLRANIVGYVALFFALSAGAYAAGLAPDSVRSKHIKNGQVKNPDLAADAVTGANVAPSSLSGSDLGQNSLGGQQIAENTLGEVPNATIAGHGGYGRQSGGHENGTSCNPQDANYVTCASVGLSPTAPARILVTGRFEVVLGAEGTSYATCRLGSSTTGGIPGTTLPLIFVDNSSNKREWVSVTGITGVFQPGNYSFGLDCKNDGGDPNVRNARVTAVAISPF